MKSISALIVLLLATCVAANAHAAGTRTMPADNKVEQKLMQLEKDWSAAYLKHDTATIEQILADEFVGIDGRGVMTDKAQELEDASAPKPGEPEPAFMILDDTITDMKVRVYGSVSIVNGRSVEKVKIRGKEANIEYRRTTVWVKRQGRWQCVSFHGSRILEQ
ncbi:MAG TPA: nuclear transport factor 2 family protein [Pyrinomonadaceae bacterium]|nr:nuclear transport factor 2 family protein [Pyrinomonadaceae bacterium]